MRLLSIDPGINTGWCYWTKGGEPHSWGCIVEPDSNARATQEQRIQWLTLTLRNLITEHLGFPISLINPSNEFNAVIESAEFWDKSHKSRTAARKGSLKFLTMLVGSYLALFHLLDIQVKLVSPGKWKGQLPDSLVKERVQDILKRTQPCVPKCEDPNIHTCCAIGIGANHFQLPEFFHVKSKTQKATRVEEGG